jgi:hypothetical protein
MFFALGCSKSLPDVRFGIVTEDGTMSTVPNAFLSALRAGEGGKSGVFVQRASSDENLMRLFTDSSVVCRVYWEEQPGVDLDEANRLRCASGAAISPLARRRIFTLTASGAICEQFFIVPKSERPVEFVANGLAIPLRLATAEELNREEKEWGGTAFYDRDQPFYYKAP